MSPDANTGHLGMPMSDDYTIYIYAGQLDRTNVSLSRR